MACWLSAVVCSPITPPPSVVLLTPFAGAVGIEMAAELKLAQPQTKVTLAHSRAKLLSSEPLDEVVGETTLKILEKGGVQVLLNHRLQETNTIATEGGADKDITTYEVVFTNGHKLRTNAVVMAMSRSTPSTNFLPAEALNEEGYVAIQPK